MKRLPSRLRAPLLLAACVLVGGALRFYYAASLYGVYLPHMDVEKDEGYHEAAVSLLAYHAVSYTLHQSKPWPFRGPLFPGFISIIEAPFAKPWLGRVRIAEAALSTLAIPAVFALGQAAASPLAGLLAALFCALDPEQIKFVGTTNVECFYSICLLAVALSATLWALKPTKLRLAVLALVTTASLMCRMAHFPLPILLGAAIAAGRRRIDWRSLGLFGALLCAFLAPWLTRNAILFGRAVPEDAEAGAFRFFSASIGERQCCDEPKQLAEAATLEPGLIRMLSGPDRYRTLTKIAIRNIYAHPLRYAETVALNAVDFFLPLALPLLLGVYALWRRPRLPALMPLLVAASFCGNALIVIGDRHQDGLLPLCSLFLGAGLAAVLERSGRPIMRPLRAGWAAAALIAIPAAAYAVTTGWLAAETVRYHGRLEEGAFSTVPLEPRAMALFEKAIPYSQGRYGLLERGQLYWTAGQTSLACADFELAERRADERGRCFALEQLSRCALLGERVDEALRRTEQRIRSCGAGDFGEIADMIYRKARRDSGAGRPELAENELDRSFRLGAPRTAAARALRAALLMRLGRAAEGRAEFDRAWNLDPTSACGPDAPDMDRRLVPAAYFGACLSRQPNDAKLLHDRGIAYYYHGDVEAAMRDLERAERSDPNLVEARLSRSTLLLELGRLKEALEECHLAASLSRDRRPQEYADALGLQDSILKKMNRLPRPGL